MQSITAGLGTRKKSHIIPDDFMRQIQQAKPPTKNRVPYGFFDPLVTPTRQLLDKGFTLKQAGEFLVSHRRLNSKHTRSFCDAMRQRISRLNRAKIKQADTMEWRAALSYESTHLVGEGENKAVCGANSFLWTPEISETNRCCRCVGIARRNQLVTK